MGKIHEAHQAITYIGLKGLKLPQLRDAGGTYGEAYLIYDELFVTELQQSKWGDFKACR